MLVAHWVITECADCWLLQTVFLGWSYQIHHLDLLALSHTSAAVAAIADIVYGDDNVLIHNHCCQCCFVFSPTQVICYTLKYVNMVVFCILHDIVVMCMASDAVVGWHSSQLKWCWCHWCLVLVVVPWLLVVQVANIYTSTSLSILRASRKTQPRAYRVQALCQGDFIDDEVETIIGAI